MKTRNNLPARIISYLPLLLIGLFLLFSAGCNQSEGRDAGGTIWSNTRSTNDPGLGNGLISLDGSNIYAITMEDGYFSVSGIPAGTRLITLAKFGIEIYSGTSSITRNMLSTDLPADTRESAVQILFEFPTGVPGDGVLYATVLDDEDQPVVGAEIDLIYKIDGSFYVTETDSAGSFYFDNLLLYPDYLLIDAEGYKPAIFEIDDIITFMDNGVDGALVNLIPLEKVEPEVGVMSGDIKDEAGNVLPGIKVALYEDNDEVKPIYSTPWIVETNDKGEYEFENIPTGDYVIWAGHPNYFPEEVAVTIGGGVQKKVYIVLEDATNAEIHPFIKASMSP